MRKLLVIFNVMLLSVCLFPACEVENCPPNSLAYAYFSFVDQNGSSISYTDTLTVIGQIDSGDSTINDTLINSEPDVSELSLPLSYGDQTRFLLYYNGIRRPDIITITHRNIPYFMNLDCGAMMFYEVTGAESTTRVLDSLVIVNTNIDNNEKENFKIYFTVTDTD